MKTAGCFIRQIEARPWFAVQQLVRCARVVLLFFLFFLPGITHAANLSSEFRDLLNGTAFVHYIKVAIPGEMYSINGKGWVYYEGSFQGETFWIKNCTNSIPGSGPALPGYTVGASSNENWCARLDGYVAKSPKVGKTQEPTDQAVLNSLLMVRSAFTPDSLKIGSLIVAEDNSFKALSVYGDTLVGRFDVFENGRPKRCEFTSSAYPKVSFVVIYDYTGRDDNSTIPSTVTHSVNISPIHVIRRKYQILDCQFGKDSIPNGGFTPNPGDPKLIMPLYRNPVIFSNSGIYQKQPDGTVFHIKEPNLLKTHRIIGWLLFIPINVALLIWLIVHARSKK
jgi:hypothetical protein